MNNFFSGKKLFTIEDPKTNLLSRIRCLPGLLPGKICLGAMFYNGFNWGIGGFGQLSVLKKPREAISANES